MFDFRYAALAAVLGVAACGDASLDVSTTGPEDAADAGIVADAASVDLPNISSDAIEAHIRFLSTDLMGGRDAGSREYMIASHYVATQMRLIGLEPAGDADGYFAMVPFQRMSSNPESARFAIGGTEYTHGQEVFISPNPIIDAADVTAELVFVGYGLSLPHHGYDDYEGVDVNGRIVVVLGGAPEDVMPTDERSHQLRGSTKRDYAAAHGAVGMITISSANSEQFAGFASRGVGHANVAIGPEGAERNYEQLQVNATVSSDVAAALFAGAPMTLEEATAALADGPQSFALNQSATIAVQTDRELYEEPNVVGMLPGSDPELADEYVVLTAHLDHIGTFEEGTLVNSGCRSATPEDQVCNGAVDNASGVSIMLETARTFVEHGAPRRSLVFVALAAEEKGLLGSEYFAENPTVPQADIVANVNLDMPVIVYEFSDVIAFGAERSELGPIAARAASQLDVTISEDPIPEQNLFIRSDHYNFVRQGIPSLFLMTGFSSPDPRWDQGEGFMGFLNTHYHRVSDSVDLELLYDQAAKFADINFVIAREIANAEERPRWNEGDFFGAYFGADR
ncbi:MULTISPECIES: M28 family metallopeptidase [Hyphobacterium]|uniref:M28 family metallopeptidase n=1 Tax=Hyphobacterium vulgare TaxID=1736751 RepID=A0ABV7A0C0_9PROT